MLTRRGQVVTFSLAALGAAAAATLFCIVQIYRTAQVPEGDGSGMQWVILTPLAMLFLFIAVPGFAAGARGLRVLRTSDSTELAPALPSRGWLIALGLFALYFLLPFIVAPLLGPFMVE